MADYKIVKGLPLPPEKQGKRISSIVRKLEVGDCAQFPGALPNSVNSTAGRILGKGKYAFRTIDGVPHIWRLA